MKSVKKTTILTVSLVIIWIMYEISTSSLSSSIENSLNSYFSTQISPVLETEIVKYVLDGGYGLSERYQDLQHVLSCLTEEALWANSDDEAIAALRSRSSGRVEFPSAFCSDRVFGTRAQTVAQIDTLCPLLPSKKILFVGPETTFHLHSNLLQALELHENRSHSCLGSEFCTFHQICRVPRLPDSSEPFFPPGGSKKYPSNRELIASHSGILRYILSNSLYTGSNKQDARYTDPVAQVDPDSGVRQKERYWIGQARKADLLVLNRGPLPAPAWTYDGTQWGNWSAVFLKDKPFEGTRIKRIKRDDGGSKSFGESILDVALRVTVDRFLPETAETLKILSRGTKTQHLLWHGSWYMEPKCTEGGDRKGVLDSDLDPWTLFYNAQGAKISPKLFQPNLTSCTVHMQNYVLGALLPHYRVLFIPIFAPRAVRGESWGYSKKSIAGRKDCLLHEFGSMPEEKMRSVLVRGMSFALESEEVPAS